MNAHRCARSPEETQPKTSFPSRSLLLLGLFAALSLAGACTSAGGAGDEVILDGSTIARAETVPPGEACPSGGERIYYGIDDNTNGVLDEEEQDGSVLICNGTEGVGTGISEGTAQSPVPLTVGKNHHALVAANGASYYFFQSPVTWDLWVGLTGLASDLAWTLYSDAAFQTEIASCDNHPDTADEEDCLTPTLAHGQTYYLMVEEQSNIPNLFEIGWRENAWLVGSDLSGKLFRINPENGASTGLGDTAISNIAGLAFDPVSGLILAVADNGGTYVHTINPNTLATQQLAGPVSEGSLEGLAIGPEDGLIYTTYTSECDYVATVDPTDGGIETVGYGPGCTWDGGLAFDGSGLLFFSDGGDDSQNELLSEIDLDEGEDFSLPNVSFSGFSSGPSEISAMAGRSADGTMFILTEFSELGTLNLETSEATGRGVLPDSFRALTWVGSAGKMPPPAVRGFTSNYDSDYGTTLFWEWRNYPRAEGFRIYWAGTYDEVGPEIDPADPSTYQGVVDAPAGASFEKDFGTEQGGECEYFSYIHSVIRPVVDGVEIPVTSFQDAGFTYSCGPS